MRAVLRQHTEKKAQEHTQAHQRAREEALLRRRPPHLLWLWGRHRLPHHQRPRLQAARRHHLRRRAAHRGRQQGLPMRARLGLPRHGANRVATGSHRLQRCSSVRTRNSDGRLGRLARVASGQSCHHMRGHIQTGWMCGAVQASNSTSNWRRQVQKEKQVQRGF